jgi:predicted GNAT family N-acyltransferase
MIVQDRMERIGQVERHDARVGKAKIWFYVDHAKRVVDISSVRVPQRERGKGEGGRALGYALGIADSLHYAARLDASPLDKRTSTYRLVRLYERFGFKTSGRIINPAGDPEMIRIARDRRRR